MSESNGINNTIYDAVSNALENKINNCNTLLPSSTGKSAYDLAVEHGYVGTESTWLNSLQGLTAYEVAVSNGYKGTKTEWLKYIKADGGIQAIQDFLTKPSNVQVTIPDYGNIPSLQGYIYTMFENGGLPATPFLTQSGMVASVLPEGSYAVVTDDGIRNGFYRKKASDWLLSDLQMLSKTVMPRLGFNLDTLVRDGVYHAYTGSSATTENKFPFIGTGAIVIVATQSEIIRQHILSNDGTAHRYAVLSGGSYTWQPWKGLKYPTTGISKISDIETGLLGKLDVGKSNYKIVSNISALAGNLDAARVEGDYFINSGNLATTANGFPFGGSGGFLKVKISSSDAIHQYWHNHNGWAYRWGNNAVTPVVWQPWKGVKNTSNSVLDIANVGAIEKLIVYGSSTMEYISDELQEMATRKNLDLRSHGISGDILGGAGQAQGSNVVEISFPNGAIGYNTPVPIIVTSSFGEHARHNRSVTLSNGVKGTMYTNNTFQAVNLTSNLPVPPSEKYHVTEPLWYNLSDGIYIFDIGKNNVSSTVDNSQFIIDKTIEMIEYIPRTANFIVGGHYSNTDSTDMHRTVVEAVNLALKNKYGLKYFDISSILFDDATWTKLGLSKTAADNTAISQRRLPPSLSRDKAHLSPAMDIELALVIENKLTSLGYIT